MGQNLLGGGGQQVLNSLLVLRYLCSYSTSEYQGIKMEIICCPPHAKKLKKELLEQTHKITVLVWYCWYQGAYRTLFFFLKTYLSQQLVHGTIQVKNVPPATSIYKLTTVPTVPTVPSLSKNWSGSYLSALYNPAQNFPPGAGYELTTVPSLSTNLPYSNLSVQYNSAQKFSACSGLEIYNSTHGTNSTRPKHHPPGGGLRNT